MDWDNTLKKSGKCSVPFTFFNREAVTFMIISAIRPSRLNLESLMIEVDRLGLRQYFVLPTDVPVIRSDYCRLGNVVICGYDKVETFIELTGYVGEGDGITFYDDEKVNIDNWRARLPKSVCYSSL